MLQVADQLYRRVRVGRLRGCVPVEGLAVARQVHERSRCPWKSLFRAALHSECGSVDFGGSSACLLHEADLSS
jgi:hypothetical protein